MQNSQNYLLKRGHVLIQCLHHIFFTVLTTYPVSLPATISKMNRSVTWCCRWMKCELVGFFPSCFGRTTFHQQLMLTCVRYTLKIKHVSRKPSMVQSRFFCETKPFLFGVIPWKFGMVQCLNSAMTQDGSVFYHEKSVWFSVFPRKPSLV